MNDSKERNEELSGKAKSEFLELIMTHLLELSDVGFFSWTCYCYYQEMPKTYAQRAKVHSKKNAMFKFAIWDTFR